MSLQFYYKNEDDRFDQNESSLTSLHDYSKYKVSQNNILLYDFHFLKGCKHTFSDL